MLDGGHFTSPAGLWRRGEDMERMVRFPVPVYLIESGEERILVDTGLHPGAAADAAGHYEGAWQVDLATVTKVVLTHLHFDHAGGLALLPPSLPIYVQRLEWEAGKDPAAIVRNFYLPRDYEAIADRVVLVDGDHDLLGDGSIELLFTPGHTPGHQSVRVGERLVIGGDVTHFAARLDDDVQLALAERLRGLGDAGAEIRPGHDPAVLVVGSVL